jgi:hypothetical protein
MYEALGSLLAPEPQNPQLQAVLSIPAQPQPQAPII